MSPCDAVLDYQYEHAQNSVSYQASYLAIIDQSQWSELKQKFGADFVIYDIPIGLSYDNFDAQRKHLFQKNQWAFSLDQYRATWRQFITDKQVDAWLSCVREQVGFYGIAGHASGDFITLTFCWSPAPTTLPTNKIENLTFNNCSLVNPKALKIGTTFLANQNRPVLFKRQKDKPLDVVVDVKGYSASVSVEVYKDPVRIQLPPPPPPPPPTLQVGTVSAVIAAAYRQILDREPDPGGLVSWSQSLVAQKSVKEIIRSFVQSEEYRVNFVAGKASDEVARILYRHLLAREGEQAGVSHWAGQIDAYQGPFHVPILPKPVVSGYLESQEYADRFGNDNAVPGSPAIIKY